MMKNQKDCNSNNNTLAIRSDLQAGSLSSALWSLWQPGIGVTTNFNTLGDAKPEQT